MKLWYLDQLSLHLHVPLRQKTIEWSNVRLFLHLYHATLYHESSAPRRDGRTSFSSQNSMANSVKDYCEFRTLVSLFGKILRLCGSAHTRSNRSDRHDDHTPDTLYRDCLHPRQHRIQCFCSDEAADRCASRL